MGPEGDAKISNAAKRNAGNFTTNESGDLTYTQPSASKGMGAMRQTPRVNSASANSLPKAIRESMLNNPIDASSMNVGGSVLDTIGYTPQQTQPQVVTEQQYAPAPQQTYYQQPQYAPMAIDYNYIRSIVNECVQANMQKIKEEILNESSLKLVRLNGGNKIQLVDNKNNLYESTLTFKKNLNKA
jgi:hypothetical protein